MSYLQILQLKVIDFYDHKPFLAWSMTLLLAVMGAINLWLSISQLSLTHCLIAGVYVLPGFFMMYCRVNRHGIVMSSPINKILDSHEGPIPPMFRESMIDIAEEHGCKAELEAFLARYDAASPPATKVVYGMLETLIREKQTSQTHYKA